MWNIHLYQSPRFLDTKPIELANAIGEYWEKALEWKGYVEQPDTTQNMSLNCIVAVFLEQLL